MPKVSGSVGAGESSELRQDAEQRAQLAQYASGSPWRARVSMASGGVLGLGAAPGGQPDAWTLITGDAVWHDEVVQYSAIA